jgi:hypothetical protein
MPTRPVDKARCKNFTFLGVFLNMLGCVVAWRNIYTAANGASIKKYINGSINVLRLPAKPAGMSVRSATLFSVCWSVFLLVLLERSLKRFRKLFCEMSVFLLKFLIPCKQFPVLPISDVHGKFKFIDSLAEIISLLKNCGWIFATKEYTKLIKGAIRAFGLSVTTDWFTMLHGVPSSSSTIKRVRPITTIEKFAIKVNSFFSVSDILCKEYPKKSTINDGGRCMSQMIRDVGLKKIRFFRGSKLFETITQKKTVFSG